MDMCLELCRTVHQSTVPSSLHSYLLISFSESYASTDISTGILCLVQMYLTVIQQCAFVLALAIYDTKS
jgi:hypothetical protein